mmetsp:Transcript_5277/g.16122  ORF Transcript_5277/g.16122 Transcript_5277/m.16122 type:complete len:262 (-) Transcript_5277:752-1537(-)
MASNSSRLSFPECVKSNSSSNACACASVIIGAPSSASINVSALATSVASMSPVLSMSICMKAGLMSLLIRFLSRAIAEARNSANETTPSPRRSSVSNRDASRALYEPCESKATRTLSRSARDIAPSCLMSSSEKRRSRGASSQPSFSLGSISCRTIFCRLASRSSFRPSRARVSDTLGAEVPEIHGWLRMSSGLMRSWGRIASMLRTSCLHEADSDDQCSSSRDACAASLIEPRMSSRCRGPGRRRKTLRDSMATCATFRG